MTLIPALKMSQLAAIQDGGTAGSNIDAFPSFILAERPI